MNRIEWHRHPSAFLLAAQLASLLLYPTMDDSGTGRLLFGAVGVVVVLLALWVVNRSPLTNWVAWCLALLAVVIYERAALHLVRRAWINFDLVWAAALVLTGIAVAVV